MKKLWLRKWVAKHTTLYRPEIFNGSLDGYAAYILGHMRAKVCGVRVPVEWAYENVMVCERLKRIHDEPA